MVIISAICACTKKTKSDKTCVTPTYNVKFISNGTNPVDQIDYVNATAYVKDGTFINPVDSVKNVPLNQTSTGATFDFMATTHKQLLSYDWKFVAMPSGRIFWISQIYTSINKPTYATFQACVGDNVSLLYKQNDTSYTTAGNNGSPVADVEIHY